MLLHVGEEISIEGCDSFLKPIEFCCHPDVLLLIQDVQHFQVSWVQWTINQYDHLLNSTFPHISLKLNPVHLSFWSGSELIVGVSWLSQGFWDTGLWGCSCYYAHWQFQKCFHIFDPDVVLRLRDDRNRFFKDFNKWHFLFCPSFFLLIRIFFIFLMIEQSYIFVEFGLRFRQFFLLLANLVAPCRSCAFKGVRLRLYIVGVLIVCTEKLND